jgi:hypothetical protein
MNVYAVPHLRDFLSRFADAMDVGGGRFKVSCCCHSDTSQSATITITADKTILYFCQRCKAKGADAARVLGLPITSLLPPPPIDYRQHVKANRTKGAA